MSTPVTPPLQCPHLHLDKVRVGDWPLYRCSACERLFPVTPPLETHVIEPVPHA